MNVDKLVTEIPILIEESFGTSKEKGFHEKDHEDRNCLETKVFLIESEVSEALEAYRQNKRALYSRFIESIMRNPFRKMPNDYPIRLFKNYIKDSVEDEIADVCIRLFDLAGMLAIENIDYTLFEWFPEIPTAFEAEKIKPYDIEQSRVNLRYTTITKSLSVFLEFFNLNKEEKRLLIESIIVIIVFAFIISFFTGDLISGRLAKNEKEKKEVVSE